MQPTGSPRINWVEIEKEFTGDGKVFIHVERQAGETEKLVIYEAKNAFTGFFLNLFRDRKTTFTAREWAAARQGKLPETIDKEKLIQNIKTAVSPSNVENASLIFDKLVQDKKLDATSDEVSRYIQDTPLGKAACARLIDLSVKQLRSTLKSPIYSLDWDGLGKLATALNINLKMGEISALFAFLELKAGDSNFGEKQITQALLSHLDTGELKKSFRKEHLQAFVKLLITMESTLTATTPSPEQVRYLDTLKRIEENLNKQSNPTAVTNAS